MSIEDGVDSRCAELLDNLHALWQLRRDSELGQLLLANHVLRGEEELSASEIVARIVGEAEGAGLAEEAVGTALTQFIVNPAKPDALSPLLEVLKARHEQIYEELGGIPPSIEKARERLRAVSRDPGHGETGYEAHVFLAEEIEESAVERIATEWREDWLEHRKQPREPFLDSQTFWVSRDNEDLFDDLARYRFYERFELGEFTTLFSEVARGIGEGLLHTAATLDPFGLYRGPELHSHAAARSIWLISRTQGLPLLLDDVMKLVLRGLCHGQSPDGSWPSALQSDRPEARSHLPDTIATAAACISIFKMSTSDSQRVQAARGINWLLEHQEPDGHWAERGVDELRGWPLLSTALALEAIVRSGRSDVDRALARAGDWLIAAQDRAGAWLERSLPHPLLSVVVLEALTLWESRPPSPSEELALARALMNRSAQLSSEDSAESRQLAVVAAHAAIETFMYAVLQHPTVGVRVLERNRTIGLRPALTKLQESYQANGTIGRAARLPDQGGVDRLAYLRDEVVHKGLRVSAPDIVGPMSQSQRFIRYVSGETLGYDLLRR
jgi:hypothetical protein